MAAFIDTNILVYGEDAAFPDKQRIAASLVADQYRRGNGVLSTQVLQDYYHTAVNKLKLDAAFAVQRLIWFAKFQVVTVTPHIIIAATDLHRLRSLSFWDSLIIQAAITSGCDTLYSEDLNSGEIIHGVRIVNPFTGKTGHAVHEA